ncbi:MAG: substrate-binding domain-containing protein [Candidatus Bipolaricaulia bacterium]
MSERAPMSFEHARVTRRGFLKAMGAASIVTALGGVISLGRQGFDPSGDITVWWAGGDPERIFLEDHVVPMVRAQYPSIGNIDLVNIPEYEEKVTISIAGDVWPDVLKMFDTETVSWHKRNIPMVLNRYIEGPEGIDMSDFWPGLGFLHKDGDQIFGIPIDAMDFAFYINVDVFDELGLDIPNNWGEMREIARKATVRRGDEVVRYGTAALLTWDYPFWAWLLQNGGQIWSDDKRKATFNNEVGLDTVQFFREMQFEDNSVIPPGVTEGWQGDWFGQQRIAMMKCGPWCTGHIELFFPDVNFEVVPLPLKRDVSPPPRFTNVLFSSIWTIARKAKNPDGAWAFLKTMMSPEAHRAWTDLGITPPGRMSVANTYMAETRPDWVAFIDQMVDSSTEYILDRYTQVRNLLGPEINNIFNPQVAKDPKRALDDAARRIEQEVLRFQ